MIARLASITARFAGRARLLRRLALGSLLCCALALRLHEALRPLSHPHPGTIPDDAFYDFAIARHLSLGHGPTFDGFTPTNGFHPLWVAILVPIWRLAGPAKFLAPIHATMIVGSLLDVAGLLVLYRICRKRLALHWLAAVVPVAWLSLNSFQVMLATCGLEAPLAQLLLLLLLDEDIATRWRLSPRRRWIVFAGLMALARVDLVLIAAFLLAIRIARARRDVPLARRVLTNLVAAAGMFAVYAPWLVYSRVTTGHWVQSSAVALPLVAMDLPITWGYASVQFATHLRMSVLALLDTIFLSLQAMGSTVPLAAAVVGSGVAAVVIVRPVAFVRLGGYYLGLAALAIAHGAVRLTFREWYAFPFCVGYALVLSLVLECAIRTRRAAIFTPIVVISLGLGIAFENHDKPDGYWGSQTLPMHVAPYTTRNGNTDGGVWGYLAGGNRVNLDGIVNWEAVDALRAGALLDYIEHEHIDRFGVADRFRHPHFMGRHWRERIIGDGGELRLASPSEKDQRITIAGTEVLLGSSEGSEFLSDGWLWPAHSNQTTVRSVGRDSEIIFFLERDSLDPIDLNLEVQSIELEDGARCSSLGAELDGVVVGDIAVDPNMKWRRFSVGTPPAGRHRLVLHPNRYGVAKANEPWRIGSWHLSWIHALTAFEVRGFHLGDVGLVGLPPEGPTLEEAASQHLLGTGWLSIERSANTPAAVWAADSSATLIFRANSQEARALVISGSAPPTGSGVENQDVDVELNGIFVGKLRFTSVGEARRLNLVDGAVHAGRNELRLRFASRWGTDPLGRAFYLTGLSWGGT